MEKEIISTEEVREYAEGENVEIDAHENGRLIVRAINQGGHDSTEIDLQDLLIYVKNNHPILWNMI